MSNPLIAPTVDSTKAYSGISLLETANDLSTAIESGDWASVAMGAVGTALDALSVAMDPFGAILAAGVSWLMEHVGPLKDALNGLTGNADQIKAQSETWANVAQELGSVASDLTDAVNADLQSWSGTASDAYRQRAQDISTLLQSAQKGTEGASSGVKTAGEVVAAVRTLVRDIISELIGHLISWALQVVFTLGIGLAWVVPQVASAVAKTASQITGLVTKLVKALKALVPLLKKAGTLFEDAGKALKGLKGGKVAPPPKTKDLSSTPTAPPVKTAGDGGGAPQGGGYEGTPKDYTPPPGKSGADDSTKASGYEGSPKDYTPPPAAKSADDAPNSSGYTGSGSDFTPPPAKSGGGGGTSKSSAGGGTPKSSDTTHTSGTGGGTPKSPPPRSPDPVDSPVHGLGDTTSSFFTKVGGVFVPGNKVKAAAGPGGTTKPSINADTLGAGNFASKYYPNLNKLNPTKDGKNCTLAITSVDEMLGGKVKPAPKLPEDQQIGTAVGPNHPLRQKNPNAGRPEDLDSWDQVIDKASEHPGSKGYVIVHRDDRSSHVMNVINTDKGVVFLDGQSGKLGKLDTDPRNLQYFRYDPPVHGAQGPPPGWTPPPAAATPPAPNPVPPAAGNKIDDVYQDWLRADQHFNG